MTRLLRPLLTLLLTIGLFATTTYFVIEKTLDAAIYLTTWIQLVSCIVSYYFAERAVTKRNGE